MIAVYLKQKRSQRVESGHPWILLNEIDRMDGVTKPGDLVCIYNHKGQFLGTGIINTHSQVMIRFISYGYVERLDVDFFKERLRECIALRKRFLPESTVCRLVSGEVDFLPGLIVDRFEDILVIQLLSAGMDVRRSEIMYALIELLQPRGIYEKSDAAVRETEDLKPRTGKLYGEVPPYIQVNLNGLNISLNVRDDSAENLLQYKRNVSNMIAPLMSKNEGVIEKLAIDKSGEIIRSAPRNGEGANVLDCFANLGVCTIYACWHGAKSVTSIVGSKGQLKLVQKNVSQNNFDHMVEFVQAAAHSFLRSQVQLNKKSPSKERKWDVMILNPPAFPHTENTADSIYQSYKEMNVDAMKLVTDGGFLITTSSTDEVSSETFMSLLEEAAQAAGKITRLVKFEAAGVDSPHLFGFAEGLAVKIAVIEIRDRLTRAMQTVNAKPHALKLNITE